MYHFLDAFTTNVLSCVTLYIDMEFSTLPVEQGHKKRHHRISLKEKASKYQFNVKTFLKQSVLSDNPKTSSSSVAKFCLELPCLFFISKVANTRLSKVSNLVLSNRTWRVKTLQNKNKTKANMFEKPFESRVSNVFSRQFVFDNTSLQTLFSLVRMTLGRLLKHKPPRR